MKIYRFTLTWKSYIFFQGRGHHISRTHYFGNQYMKMMSLIFVDYAKIPGYAMKYKIMINK